MTTWFITRHPGARAWAEQQGLSIDRHATHLDPAEVAPGDTVIGTLPVHLAAEICQRGARYLNLSLDLPASARGRELGADELLAYNARLEAYAIQSEASAENPAEGGNCLHIVLATGENLPNLIPVLAPNLKASEVIIIASRAMQDNAEKLRYGLQQSGLPEARCRLIADCPDHNLPNILAWANQQARQIATEAAGKRCILNLTGGNKLMTIGFLQAFRPHAEIIYCDTEAGRIDYFHPIGREQQKLPVNLLTLKPYLAVQGYKLRDNSPDVSGMNTRADLTRQLVQSAPRIERLIGQMNGAAYHFRDGRLDRAGLDAGGNSHEQNLLDMLVERKILKKTGRQFTIFDDSAATYLGGGWLEEWCWLIGKELEQGEPGKRLSHSRWGINLMIDPWNHLPIPGRNQHPLNELDAVFIHRNRMLLIECKSGQQISERGESQSILNKLETLGKHVGGRLDTKWLLTARSIDRNTQARQRAEKYNIKLIRPDELADLKTAILRWMTQ
ncbi:CRISPR-associated protein Csx16 [Azonexus sp.]|uniref:CRISPR-associated protein Csx16 n=1 Tax=Azonexus sp. TaxID=1872668 RepID=UPI0039E3D591